MKSEELVMTMHYYGTVPPLSGVCVCGPTRVGALYGGVGADRGQLGLGLGNVEHVLAAQRFVWQQNRHSCRAQNIP